MHPVSDLYFLLISLSVLVNLESKVCRNVYVVNTPENIHEFRDCTVVEGYLQIVLMENINDGTSFLNTSFPHLYEITDYLIVFKVVKLKSLLTIFPKLRVIKGNTLFLGYALILYNLADLEDISLTSLQRIENGGVKIGKCPKLCYVETVNWAAIRVPYLNIDRSPKCKNEFCPKECSGHCWNRFRCQRTTENRCHRACIGCTKIESPKHCDVCKYYNDSGICVETCPDHKITDDYASVCLKPEECASKTGDWSILNKACIPKCPSLYERDSKGDCVFTGQKQCDGLEMKYTWELKLMTNCTHINGSLVLNRVDDTDLSNLETFLGMIVEISGYLKISRSRSITTLNFFKSLKRIGGKKLWSKHYAIFVVKNPNLETLWDSNDIVVKKGEALFQDNPYLCEFEIKNLKNITTGYSNNNGNETCCKFTKLSLNVTECNPTNVTIMWTIPEDKEKIIGYVIYYKQNDSHGYEWNTIFVSNNSVQIKGLAAMTTYVYYIKTLFMPKGFNKTSFNYFETEIGDPSEPVNLQAFSRNDTTIELNWRPASYINGRLYHYKLAVYFQEDYLPMIQQRDYCLHPHHICSCPVQEEIRIFLSNDTCMGNNKSHFCNSIYYTSDEPSTPIIKLDSKNTDVQEFNIKNNNDLLLSAVVTSLRHFTMYTFYMRACNQKNANESEHCGAAAMTFRRTCEQKSFDIVKTIHVQIQVHDAVITWTKPEEPNSVIVAYHIEYKRMDLKNSAAKLKCISSWPYKHNVNVTYRLQKLGNGTYGLRVLTVSLAGPGEWSGWEYFKIYRVPQVSHKNTGPSFAYGLLGLLVIPIVLGFVIWRWYKSKYNIDDPNPLILRSKLFEDDDEWRLDDETVEIVRELEQNSIGIIYRNVVQ